VPMPAVVPERMEGASARELPVRGKRCPAGERVGVSQVRSGQARASCCRICNVIEPMGALAMDRGLECRSAGMTDMGGQIRIQVRSQVRTATDPAAGNTRAAHMDGAAAHAHRAAAEMSAATPATEVSTAAAATEVTTAAAAAKMSTATAAAAETAASSGVSNSRQTKGNAYCGRACCDFPHDTTSSSGQIRKLTPRSTGPFPRTRNWRCCNAHVA
jgi:hypothetical protein